MTKFTLFYEQIHIVYFTWWPNLHCLLHSTVKSTLSTLVDDQIHTVSFSIRTRFLSTSCAHILNIILF